MLAAIIEDDTENWTNEYLEGLEQTGRLDFEIKPMDAEEYNEFCRNINQNQSIKKSWSEIYLDSLRETGRMNFEIYTLTVEELNSMWRELFYNDAC